MTQDLVDSDNFSQPFSHHKTGVVDQGGGVSEEQWQYIKSTADVADYLLYAFSFPSLMVNAHVLHAGTKLYRRSCDPSHLLVCSMTAADALTCAMHQLYVTLSRFAHGVQHPTLLSVQMALTWIGYSASGFSLCMLNIEKFVYFYYPLQYASFVTSRSVTMAVVACWSLCVAYATAMLCQSTSSCGDGVEGFCLLPDASMFYCYVLLFSILPVLSSASLSAYLWFVVKSTRRKTYVMGGENPRGGKPTEGASANGHYLKTNVFIFTVTAWVAVSWLPARAHFIFLLENNSLWASWVGLMANYAMLLSPMVNPLLTIAIDANYRKFTRKTVKTLRKHYKQWSRSVNVVEETFL